LDTEERLFYAGHHKYFARTAESGMMLPNVHLAGKEQGIREERGDLRLEHVSFEDVHMIEIWQYVLWLCTNDYACANANAKVRAVNVCQPHCSSMIQYAAFLVSQDLAYLGLTAISIWW